MDVIDRSAVGGVFHVMNKSIAEYRIFSSQAENERASLLLSYYSLYGELDKFSRLKQVAENTREDGLLDHIAELGQNRERRVDVWAYCLMPTHMHLLLRQRVVDGISSYMSDVLYSYSRYFNTAHKRKGPLWVGRYKSVAVNSDEQLLHVSRYIHLNPVAAHLVDRPEEWQFSSYASYVAREQGDADERELPCHLEDLPFSLQGYRAFAEDGIDYQRSIADLKRLVIE